MPKFPEGHKDLNSYDSAVIIETQKVLYCIGQCSHVLQTRECTICAII